MDDEEKKQIPTEGHVPPEYEASFLNLWTIILVGVVLVVLIVLIHFLAAGLFGFFALRDASPQPPSPVISEAEGITPPEIERRVEGRSERDRLYATQAARIGEAGLPIERAMEMIAGEGLPDFGEGEFVLPERTPGAPLDEAALVEAGAQVFQSLGCAGCHRELDTSAAPTLIGVFGSQRTLESGETVLADEAYIHESILQPGAKIVAGYQPIMPSFAGSLSEDQLEALIAYIASLGD
jgi:mono/diheme cytochrome c family protein